MPLVIVRCGKKITKADQVTLGKNLPDIVALALTVPSEPKARLSADEVEVRFTSHGPRDVNVRQLDILVFATHSRGRAKNLKARGKIIRGEIHRRMPDITRRANSGSVWVRLARGEWDEL